MINEGGNYEDVENSAEVEQVAEQGNECETAICANVIGVQSQIGAAAVANLGGNYEDIENSAEIEQVAEQGNECETLFALTLLEFRLKLLLLQ